MAAWDNGARKPVRFLCLCQPPYSRWRVGAGAGGQRAWFGQRQGWGDLPLSFLCVLSLQPPGAQWDQVHPPRSLLSLQKASEDVSASCCFLRVSMGLSLEQAGHSPGAGPESACGG